MKASLSHRVQHELSLVHRVSVVQDACVFLESEHNTIIKKKICFLFDSRFFILSVTHLYPIAHKYLDGDTLLYVLGCLNPR